MAELLCVFKIPEIKVKQCSRLFRQEKQDIKHFPRANSFYYMEAMLNYSLPHFQFSKQL